MQYRDFVARKLPRDLDTGFACEHIDERLYPFQQDIVRWALRRGRAAIFADCGLGKTPMQLLQFRKPGDNPSPIRAGISEKYGNEAGWITQQEWIEWASPVWHRQSDKYPRGIRETNVLNVAVARDSDDERHLCPLQLDVIERAVKLWSNPGDTVLSPFGGIGSEGVGALRNSRRFVGIELKRSYFETACANLTAAEGQLSLLAA